MKNAKLSQQFIIGPIALNLMFLSCKTDDKNKQITPVVNFSLGWLINK